ncbi:YicC/YloC family endoribonuclease [Marinimicrobium alkaliphilum]|uniref:YicC/YloC family endoribonuclease n=1 Tax=Marinimicrobium alkaliphilum TaxID=2202654 RepID=UPI000DBAC690|nr:YicC/YloC family endoribonuclease [Marinimicrobium alkaliphilum]
MPRSMTGFARSEQTLPWGTLIWEVRSVNHRYLEPMFRLPEEVRAIEPKLREQIRSTLQRGKLEAAFSFQREHSDVTELNLDEQRVAQLTQAAGRISAHLGERAAPINALEVLRWPGVLRQQELDRDQLNQAALGLFNQALEQLVAHRTREGVELMQFIQQRLDRIDDLVAELREAMPVILSAQRERLQSKIAALDVDLDPERLEQEIVMMAQKADVDEELDRLGAHVNEVKLALQQKGSIGRRLDFLMQELNREANTLSSKSVASKTTQAAVELKVLIEQMREQIQNIE